MSACFDSTLGDGAYSLSKLPDYFWIAFMRGAAREQNHGVIACKFAGGEVE